MENKLVAYVKSHTEYNPADIMETLNSMSKDEVIAFLAWNDPSGNYTDLEATNGGVQPLDNCRAKLAAMAGLWNATRRKGLAQQIMDIRQDGVLIIREMMVKNNYFIEFAKFEDITDEDDQLTDEFLESSVCLIVDTEFLVNEEMHPLNIGGNEHSLFLTCIDTQGDTHNVDLFNVDDSVLCEFADWLKDWKPMK